MDEVLNEVALILDRDFLVKPILYASYGLEKVLNKSFHAADIDLFIPLSLFKKRAQLIQVFSQNGYQFIEAEVLSFCKNNITVELAKKETWFSKCDLQENGLLLPLDPECHYLMLDADNLLRLYRYLSKLENRLADKRKKDLIKIKALETFLNV